MIGAGAAGLAAARQLDRVGLEPVVFEAEQEIGGTWIYTEEIESDPLGIATDRRRIHTSMYAALRTNLPRDLMAFREFPFDSRGGGEDTWPRFPPHGQVLTYLRRYAEHFGLVDRIRFASSVSRVRPERPDGTAWTIDDDEPAAWRVRIGSGREERFDAVVVCNGHYAHAEVPSLPGAGDFPGQLLHSHNYRHAEVFAGLRVALLGARASGVDLALEIADHAREVHLCARGVKARQSFGRFEGVHLQPPITSLDAQGGVTLADETRIGNVDALVFCTGYAYRLPFLETGIEEHRVVSVEDNWVHPLHLDLFAARAATLGLVGLANRIIPFPQYELQSRLLARVLAGEVEIADRAERERAARERADELRRAGVAQRHFLQQGDGQFAYNERLARLAGEEPPVPAFEEVYKAVENARFRDPKGYRDASLPWVDAESERLAAVAGGRR